MKAIKIANLLLMFLLELGVLAGAAVWGATLAAEVWVRVIAALGAPVLFIIMWSLFGAAGGARFPLNGRWRLPLELVWFGGGAVAWGAGIAAWVGVAFFAVWVLNAVARYFFHGSLIADTSGLIDTADHSSRS